jgi:hypothetical protein
MNIETLETGMISIRYMRTNGVFQFTDSIIMTAEEFAVATPEDITVMQDQRFAQWLENVTVSSDLPTTEQPVIEEQPVTEEPV